MKVSSLSMLKKVLIIALFPLMVLPAVAFELPLNMVSPQCPFIHQDEYSFESLLSLVESELEIAQEHRESCYAQFNNIIHNLRSIDEIYNLQANPELQDQIEQDILVSTLADLRAEKASIELAGGRGTTEHDTVISRIDTFEQELTYSKIDGNYGRLLNKESKEIQQRRQSLNHLNDLFINIRSMTPECSDQLGGWGTILPSLMSTTGIITGFSGFAAPALIGGALQVLSNISILFQNRDIVNSLEAIEDHRNQKVLACTYHAIKHSACEYRRAYNYSKDSQRMIDLIRQKFNAGETKKYEHFFFFNSQIGRINQIFQEIAQMGSAFTLDLGLIFDYFRASRARPQSIDTTLAEQFLNNPGSVSEAEINRWLLEVSIRGIAFIERSNTGNLTTLADRVKEALDDISQKIANIDTLEEVAQETRSFVDLRNELVSTFPDIQKLTKKMINYLNHVKTYQDFAEGIEVVNATLEMLNRLNTFLSVKQGPDSYEIFQKKVNVAGAELFNAMAAGSIAQITQQTVLLVGGSATARVTRVFNSIENYFLKQDLVNVGLGHTNYSEFKRDYALELMILDNVENISGSGRTFRAEDIDVAMSSFENGFEDEIDDLFEKVFETESRILQDHDGVTASHMCALFNEYLDDRTKKKCQENYKYIENLPYFGEVKQEIDYEDPCFYSNYIREEDRRKLLLQRERARGFSSALEEGFIDQFSFGNGETSFQCSDEQLRDGCYSDYEGNSCICPFSQLRN